MAAEPPRALWAYCVTPAGPSLDDGPAGVDAAHAVRSVTGDGLAVHVSAVDLAEYGAEPLRENLNDFAWLERVARAHEAVLEHALARTALVPLRLCTIFADEAAARAMLAERATELAASLRALEGRDEWSVKVLADPGALTAAARGHRGEEVGAAPGSGAAYLLRRRAEREDRAAAERLAAGVVDDIHARLTALSAAAVTNAPQNRELSGHEGDMLLNGAYLVERDRGDELRALVAELGERDAALGVRLVLSGPFPPYNFSAGS